MHNYRHIPADYTVLDAISIDIDWNKFLVSAGLDEISSEKDNKRKVDAKPTQEQRKKVPDEDEDYKPKLTPGCQPIIPPFIFSFCLTPDFVLFFSLCQ